MTERANKLIYLGDLRRRAQAKLEAGGQQSSMADSASRALGVVHQLALSASTAQHALALLHELQVHQVEIEMQSDELRAALARTESLLAQQRQCHDHLPVACCTVDEGSRIIDINHTGAVWLGGTRETLIGQALMTFLSPDSQTILGAQWHALAVDGHGSTCEVTLLPQGALARHVLSVISKVPSDEARFNVVMMARPIRSGE
ncbi:MAG: PAS domain-containing protein [Aquabacterium sp.]|uniref:PAS domain-containing protein n=1 Tax=Aquabacterium sp. TaxID=1872578 RepID=UPI003BB9F95B